MHFVAFVSLVYYLPQHQYIGRPPSYHKNVIKNIKRGKRLYLVKNLYFPLIFKGKKSNFRQMILNIFKLLVFYLGERFICCAHKILCGGIVIYLLGLALYFSLKP